MPTLVYSPAIKIFVDTARDGLLDLSEDISSGRLTLTENATASLNFTLLNHRRKYDGVFTPNDRVHVQLKRVAWMPVFSGYLDTVPMLSVYPRSVPLKATCTLKRLKNRLWDQGASASVELLVQASAGMEMTQNDGGLRDKVIALLTQVAEWPRETVHIGMIPHDWAEHVAELHEKVREQIGSTNPDLLGTSGAIQGTNAAAAGSMTMPEDGPGTGYLPVNKGRASFSAALSSGIDITNPMDIDVEELVNWEAMMRWPYLESTGGRSEPSRKYLTPTEESNARRWWRNRKVLVVNPKTNKGVVLKVGDWGPNEWTGYDLSVSKYVLETALGGKVGDFLDIRFADDTAKLGPLRSGSTDTGGSGSSAGETYRPALLPEDAAAAPSSVEPGVPAVVQGAGGLRFTDAENLEGNTYAARQFIKSNWNITKGIGGYADRYIAGTTTKSDHATGLALDVMVSSGEPTSGELSLGNSVALWFVANPNAFGVKYVIWNDRINTGNGWRTYGPSARNGGRHPSPTQGHRDHVHISFENTGQTDVGPMGGSFPGATAADFDGSVMPGEGIMPSGEELFGSAGQFLNAAAWVPTPDWRSDTLTGPRTLLNDKPVYETIAMLTNASMRSFMAAPNGDFIAWFPDYFGVYGTAGVMTIRDIELANEGFTVAWSDDYLVTHQFTAGSFTGYAGGPTPGGEISVINEFHTEGIASVEFPELMEALFNIDRSDPRAALFRNADTILQRFGARVNFKPLNLITGPEAEFWYAVHLFMRSWANQFSSQVDLTFMPEVYPGMLLRLEGFGVQFYVTQVTHSWDFNGGGFSTSVNIAAPSATDHTGLFGIPKAGGFKAAPQRGTGSGGARLL